MKKIISILISIILLVGCSAEKNYGSSEKVTESAIETTATTTSETTAQKVYEKKSLYDIMLTLPQNPPVGKPATQMSEKEVLSVGNTVACEFIKIYFKYFSDTWYLNVKCTPNTDKSIKYSNICELNEYTSFKDFAIAVNNCMTEDAFKKLESDGGYIEINGLIYRYDYAYGWPFGSECHLSSYQIIDDNTIKFIFNVDEDPNAEAHQCSFIAKNIGGWKVSDIDFETANTLSHQFVVK